MLEDASLRDAVKKVRHLLSCESVHIVLGCTIPELRHPFLDQLLISGYADMLNDGTIGGAALLQYEYIRGLCDVALYKGQLSASNALQWNIDGTNIQSIMLAPLEVPSGDNAPTEGIDGQYSSSILGLILCTGKDPDTFSPGERLLLQQFLPRITELLVRAAATYIAHDAQDRIRDGNRAPTMLRPEATDAYAEPTTVGASQSKVLEPLKNEFISMLSHELRAPITAIKGYAILLQAYGINSADEEESKPGSSNVNSDEELTPIRQREYLDIIMEQTNHLEVLISDLLDISRMQAGRLVLRYSRVNLAELCERAVQIVQQKANQQYPNRHTFRCTIDSKLPIIWSDAGRLRQILTNLLENAVKYSPEGGLIEILADTHDEYSVFPLSLNSCPPSEASSTNHHKPAMVESRQAMFTLTVRDHGIGIPQQQQPHLFKPFSRLEHPLTHEVHGAGLGLYITHKLIEALGGNIRLQSEKGKGTSITCFLPINRPQNADFTSIGTC